MIHCNKRIKHSYRVSTFVKPESGKCCSPIREEVRAATHYYRRALQTLIHGKNIISSLLFAFLASTSASIQSQNNVSKYVAEGSNSINTR